ncbi:hypothetical protein D5S17_35660 [Pseudonocardiaceae bacterium YIM PH 21723]|nr:hypothetical protein D5S17_35660 [Pseudonocardiaceae bacterium YIM PH 21723]
MSVDRSETSRPQPSDEQITWMIRKAFEDAEYLVLKPMQFYAHGLLNGMYKPVTDKDDWAYVLRAYNRRVDDVYVMTCGDRLELDEPQWRAGIRLFHGLAWGDLAACRCLDRDHEQYVQPDPLHPAGWPTDKVAAPVDCIDEQAFHDEGLKLMDLAQAFGGDTRKAAAAFMRAWPMASI